MTEHEEVSELDCAVDELSADERERREDQALLLERLDTLWLRALRLLVQYRGNRDMALDCLTLALGQGEMIGMHSAVEIAKKHFGTATKKAAVTKCVKMFQDCLGIYGMPGQRSESGRNKMSQGRNSQLK